MCLWRSGGISLRIPIWRCTWRRAFRSMSMVGRRFIRKGGKGSLITRFRRKLSCKCPNGRK
ncbi:hypothetical protein NEOLEDRAFT_718105 [Neolentinus lepideus HHB14362 ss-1]|uniref:Uncharacterized protein n=1 Tax=Neolentinus lepideus HHB14362 ss-1 TaxID=1314782 RepID=A0A165Q592_9AGAM|nr:hypothetical protein NEOLEDRAFT_718105 [Neolentinus lepideus HHB14362 ss-1]